MSLLKPRTSYLSWSHDTPLPYESDASPNFLSWHVFDSPSGAWSRLQLPPRSDQTLGQNITNPESPELNLATWNVDAFADHPGPRMAAVLSTLRNQSPTPNVLFFQEVSRAALDFYWVTSGSTFDTEHGTMRPGPVWRVKYPSLFGRDALCCDIFLPSSGLRIRLINVHLDSLPVQPCHRPRQLAIVASYLRSARRGLVAGDFNPVLPEDETLVPENDLVDAWGTLHPEEAGFTWGIDGQQLFPPCRMDKVAMVGLEAKGIDVIHPGTLSTSTEPVNDSSSVPWSDHSGLRCTVGLALNL